MCTDANLPKVWALYNDPNCTESKSCCTTLSNTAAICAACQQSTWKQSGSKTMSYHCIPEGSPCVGCTKETWQIKLYANCYIMNFFQMLSGWTTIYILCRRNLVTAARCLPPAALNLHAALAFADFWRDRTRVNNYTQLSGKPPRV
jgi:hypothetical protein